TTVGDKTQALENYKKAFRMNPYETYLLNEIANFEHDVP
ncbi:MAG: hypothetical protein JWN76_2802, partial [Chitinophagaceae bacterium]|nr:hypothetical protein [Chitinophagaceae bacterium]